MKQGANGKLGEFDARLEALHESHRSLAAETARTFKEIRLHIDESNDRLWNAIKGLSDELKPRWHTYAAWASVMLAVISVIGALLGYTFKREINHVENDMRSATNRNRDDITALEKHIVDNQMWIDGGIRDDLKELREWRSGKLTTTARPQ